MRDRAAVKEKTEVSFFQRASDALMRPLFGRDVFISYSRQDATAYVQALAEEVRKSRPELSICIDQWAAKPYETTHPDLLAEARRSSMFIVVASEHAVCSTNVAGEIDQFLGTGRYMLAIDVDHQFGTGDKWSPYAKERLRTTDPVPETKAALGTPPELQPPDPVPETKQAPGTPPPEPKPPKPSPHVVSRVAESITFETQTRRIKRYAIRVGAGALVVIGLASGISWWRINEAQSVRDGALAAGNIAKIRRKRAIKDAANANAAAKDATAKAKRATSKATREQDIATALGNANEATILLQQQPHLVRRASELAVGAMDLLLQRDVRNLAADMALRDALQVLPQMRRDVPLHRLAQHAAFSPDGQYFVAIDGADVMLYETGTGQGHRLAGGRHPPDARWGAIVFSRDSSRVAVASGEARGPNGWIDVWDTKQRTSLCVIPAAGFDPDVLAVSPDGSSVAFAAGESLVVDPLDPSKEVVRPAGEVLRSVAFNPKGDLIVTAGEQRVCIWSTDVNVIGELPLHGAPVFAQFSPDGKRVAVGTGDGLSVYAWPSKQRWVVNDLPPPYANVKFSGDGRLLAVSALKGDDRLRIYDAADGHPICTIATRADQIAFNADASRIATGSFHIARLWRLPDGRELGRASHPPSIPFVAFRAGGDVVSAGDRLKVWRPRAAVAVDHPVDANARMRAIAFDPRSGDLAITMAPNIERFRFDGKVAPCRLRSSPEAVLFTPKGHLIGGVGKTVRVWTDWCRGGTDGRVIAELPGTVMSLALTRDGRTLAIGGATGPRGSLVRIVTDWAGHPRTIDLLHPEHVFSLVFLADGRLVSGSNDGVRVWNWQTRSDRPVRMFPSSDVRSVAADRTGRWLACATGNPSDAAAMIWDLHAAGDAPAAVIQHDTSVFSVDFDPTGQFLATAGADRMVHVWEGWRGTNPSEVARLRFAEGVTQVVFRPDGRMLAAMTTRPHPVATITLLRPDELVAAGRAALAVAESSGPSPR
jgi:WD40 repeat protein